jgi:hypothetical protein
MILIRNFIAKTYWPISKCVSVEYDRTIWNLSFNTEDWHVIVPFVEHLQN